MRGNKRKAACLAAVLAVLLLLAGCSGGAAAQPLPEGLEAEAVTEAGREIAGLLSAGDYQAVHEALRDNVRGEVTPEDLAAVMDPVLEQAGTLVSVEETSAYGDSQEEPLGIADLMCAFSQEKVRFRVAFDPEMNLTGFSVGVVSSGWSFSNLVDSVTGLFGG